jgi:hypothetical protein
MKRTVVMCLVAALATPLAEPALAARKVVVRKGPNRTTVVVHRGHPIRRPLPVVVVRPSRVVMHVRPAVFIRPVVWSAVVVTLPPQSWVMWRRSEPLDRMEGWTDFILGCDKRGSRMFLEIDGRTQLNFAEIVFENGETQVVDFKEHTKGPGHYELVNFKQQRRIDHVRMVARATSERALVTVKLTS